MAVISTSNMRASLKEKLERVHSSLPQRRKPPPHSPATRISTPPSRKTLNIWEFLHLDTRPLFILDKKAASIHLYGDLADNAIIYKNRAFERLSASMDVEVMVLKFVNTTPGHSTYVAGRVWGTYLISGGEFLVCTGDSVAITEGGDYNHWGPDTPRPEIHRETTKDLRAVRERVQPTHQLLDWTRYSASLWLPQHYRSLAAVKWKRSPISSITRWSSSLRAMVNSIMVHPSQSVLFWGDKYTVIYNEPYAAVCRKRHPELLGKELRTGWPEAYQRLRWYLDKTMRGYRFSKLGDVVPVDRGDPEEESYFNWTLTPIIEKGGNVGGCLWQQNEVTSRVLGSRRQQLLRALRSCTAIARCATDFWAGVLEGFDSNTYDSPFVMIYEIKEQNYNEAVLLGMRGIPSGHVIAPKIRILGDSEDLFAEEIRQSRVTGARAMKHNLRDYDFMMEIAGRGWQLPCKSAAVMPIQSSDGKRVEAVVILGINPRRPFDTEYEIWLDQVQHGITAHLADLRTLEASVRRVVQDKIDDVDARRASELSIKLKELAGELRQTELMFSNMASVIPVGLQELDAAFRPLYTNDAWHEIMLSPREHDTHWTHIIHADDMSLYTQHLEKAAETRKQVVLEYRIDRPGNSEGAPRQVKWVSANILPIFTESGDLNGFYVTAMDITILKDAEVAQKERADEAVEVNKRQERFIDMTCHELRNPLSAILQSAEFILDLLENPDKIDVQAIADSCNTIMLCTTHQRRIVDDILITSKLDSDLLPVNPIRLRPASYLRKSLKMFDSEVKSQGITLDVIVDPSYEKANISWAAVDPARLLQILVNLITNAIKFTADVPRPRSITVTIGASTVEPTTFGPVTFAPRDPKAGDKTDALADFEGDKFYLIISVTDTGIGISREVQTELFRRFQQAPKTESKYGGSGLGLYICKNLARLQGGGIGIHSVPNEGSTFSFFVESRRTRPAEDDAEVAMFLTPGSVTRSRNVPSASSKNHADRTAGSSPERPVSIAAQSTHSKEADTNQSPVQGFKILIVEDNLLNQRILKKQLDSKRCITHTASNGHEAVEFLVHEAGANPAPEHAIEVCLMDCEMPVMNGIEASRRIRELQSKGVIKRHIPILGVSANVRQEKVREMREAGMDDVISKPFRLVDLMEKAVGLVMEGRVREWRETAGEVASYEDAARDENAASPRSAKRAPSPITPS